MRLGCGENKAGLSGGVMTHSAGVVTEAEILSCRPWWRQVRTADQWASANFRVGCAGGNLGLWLGAELETGLLVRSGEEAANTRTMATEEGSGRLMGESRNRSREGKRQEEGKRWEAAGAWNASGKGCVDCGS